MTWKGKLDPQTEQKARKAEKPIPSVYPVLDNDLARDNIENDIPAADLEDLRICGNQITAVSCHWGLVWLWRKIPRP